MKGKIDYKQFQRSSYEEPFWQSLRLVIHGKFGVGKTALAATASEYFPEKWPTERHKGAEPKYVLKDMFFINVDDKATAGFRERGIAVSQFDLPYFMATKEDESGFGWGPAGFSRAPTIMQAANFALNVAESMSPRFLVVDTVTALDRSFVHYWNANCPMRGGQKDTQSMYGEVRNWHSEFAEACRNVAPCVIWTCHSTVIAETSRDTPVSAAQKDVLRTAEGGFIAPDITGKGKSGYKAHASLQLAVLAKRTPQGLQRYVSPIWTKDHETKNRWELSLGDTEEPYLRKMFQKITE